jgi:WD40 repeat protein
MVMEYLQGKSLAKVVEERGGALGEQEAVGYILKVCEALDVVHKAGYLHRDLKPENIIVCGDGRVVLVDFGAARGYMAGKTGRMTVILTPGFAPLEQYAEQAQRGAYTDIYALGATLYYLLTGQVPVSAADRMSGVELKGVREVNGRVSRQVEEAVRKALAMRVEERPQSVEEFVQLLTSSAPTPVRAPTPKPRRPQQPSSPTTPAPTPVRTPTLPPMPTQTRAFRRVYRALVWSVLAILLIGLGIINLFGRQEQVVSTPAESTDTPIDIQLVRTLKGHTAEVRSVSFSPDGRLLASGSEDGTIKLWRVSDGSLVRTLTGHAREVDSVSFSPDGRLLASGSGDNTIKLWRVSDGVLVRTLHPDSVYSVSFSPDGRLLASGGWQGIKLWRVADGSLVRTLEGHAGWVRSVSFSPDGSLLASGSEDKTIKLWRVADGSLVRTLTGHTQYVDSVSFSPDGRLLASGSADYTIKLWRVSDGVLVRTLHPDSVCVSFSPDGRLLASGGWQGIKLWRVADGSEVRTLTGHTDWVNSVSFSPDGRLLASGSGDSTIKLWRVADGALR